MASYTPPKSNIDKNLISDEKPYYTPKISSQNETLPRFSKVVTQKGIDSAKGLVYYQPFSGSSDRVASRTVLKEDKLERVTYYN